MDDTRINTLNEYIETLNSKLSNNGRYAFRGQADSTYKLVPGIGRYEGISGKVEESMLNEFKRCYCIYSSHNISRRMDLLFLAQHYGMATRLLDWTLNPLIALYFACSGNPEADGAVFIKPFDNSNVKENSNEKDIKENSKTKKLLRENSVDENPFEISENLMIFPDNIDIRYQHQKGLFEIFAEPKTPTEYDEKLIIPKDKKNSIIENLKLFGIDSVFIFPTLEQFTKLINEQYLTPKKEEV